MKTTTKPRLRLVNLFAILTFCILCFSSKAQYSYELRVQPNFDLKGNLKLISEEIDFTARHLTDSTYKIMSNINYTREEFESIISQHGFEMVTFIKSSRQSDNTNASNQEKACCTITIDMFDSFGDGWDGGELEITINGTTTFHSVSAGLGSETNTLAYCDGDVLEIAYSSGSWEGENTYTISTPAGTLISDGPSPTTGNVFYSTNACSSTSQSPTSEDCEGSTLVCSNSSFSGNSNGSGTFDELNATNDGCLNGENQTSWYYVNVGSSGTLAMDIIPSNGTDDYDFAIWGPFDENTANANCSPTGPPIRCSYTQYPRSGGWSPCGTNTNPTGLAINAGYPTTTGACPDQPYIRHLDALAGEVYILVIDNFSGSSQPFDLNWSGSAVLDCTPIVLPVELVDFSGKNIVNENILTWETQSELNNSHFVLQHSTDGKNWKNIDQITGAGTTTVPKEYQSIHRDFIDDINYYRLKQVDYNGDVEILNVVSIENSSRNSLIKRVNTLGQEVDEQYEGIIIEYYEDGTIRKYFNR